MTPKRSPCGTGLCRDADNRRRGFRGDLRRRVPQQHAQHSRCTDDRERLPVDGEKHGAPGPHRDPIPWCEVGGDQCAVRCSAAGPDRDDIAPVNGVIRDGALRRDKANQHIVIDGLKSDRDVRLHDQVHEILRSQPTNKQRQPGRSCRRAEITPQATCHDRRDRWFGVTPTGHGPGARRSAQWAISTGRSAACRTRRVKPPNTTSRMRLWP